MDEASLSQSEGHPEPGYKITKPFDVLDWKLYQFMRNNEEEFADHFKGGFPGTAPEDDAASSVGAEYEREIPVHAFLLNPYRIVSTDDDHLGAMPPVPRQSVLQAPEMSANPDLASGEAFSVRCSKARGRLGLKLSDWGPTLRLVYSIHLVSNASRPSEYAVPRIWL
jgi:hypothetical protein